jgi:hypothetical protein
METAPRHRSAVLLLALALLACPARPHAAEWSCASMAGVTSTCVTDDHVHGRVFVGTIEGFHYYDIATGQWISRDWSGWIGRQVYAIDWHETLDQRVITGRENAFFKGYIMLSDDLGQNEQLVYSSNGGSVMGMVHDPTDPNRYYACTWSDVVAGEIVRSLDGGVHWTLLSGTIQHAMTSMTIDSGGTVYVGGSSRVTRSRNGGDTWEPAWNGLPSGYGIYCVTADPEEEGRLCASNDLGIYRSLDGGDNWTMVADIDCRNIDWARTGWVVPGSPSPRPVAAVTWDHRVLVSHNFGVDWEDETGNLPGTPVDLAFSEADGYLYVATDGAGTFRARITDPSAVEPRAGDGAALTVSVPDPFSPGTRIAFTTPSAGEVSCEILDLNGRRVASLGGGWLPGGTHTLAWRADGVSAGIYWLRVRASSEQRAARVVLIR